jgi:hypothetical protein
MELRAWNSPATNRKAEWETAMQSELDRLSAALDALMRKEADRLLAELVQMQPPQDPGPLTLEKLQRICGIEPARPKRQFRFVAAAMMAIRIPVAASIRNSIS